MSDGGKRDSEIRSRNAMWNAAFEQVRTILRNIGIDIQTKIGLLKTFAWSVMLFGCKRLTINKEMRTRLEAAEMCFVRRLLSILLRARRTDKEFVRSVGVKRENYADI